MFTQSTAPTRAATTGPPPAQPFAWVSHHAMTSEQYQAYFDQYVAQGLRLTWVSGYSLGAQDRYAAIWVSAPGPAFVAHHRMTSAQYQAYFDQYTGQGYRLTCVSGYAIDGVASYAAIWEKTTGPAWVARHGLTSAQYQAEFDQRVAQGYRLALVDGYPVGGSDLFAAIFTQGGTGPWVAHHDLTAQQYQANFDQYVGEGYRLTGVSGYAHGSVANYAALWEKNAGPSFVARHGLTSPQYQQAFDQYLADGYRLARVDGYEVGGVDYYAAIWTNG